MIKRALILGLLAASLYFGDAYALDTGWMTCGTVTEDTGVGTDVITNPGNVVNAAGGTPALVDWGTGTKTSSRIKCHNLPAAAAGLESGDTITGLSFSHHRSEDSTSDNIGTMEIYPVDENGAVVTTTNSSDLAEWDTGNDTTLTQVIVGGDGNLMGWASVTADKLLDADAGVSLRVWTTTDGTTNGSGTTPDGQLAEFRVKYFYTEGGGGGGPAARKMPRAAATGAGH